MLSVVILGEIQRIGQVRLVADLASIQSMEETVRGAVCRSEASSGTLRHHVRVVVRDQDVSGQLLSFGGIVRRRSDPLKHRCMFRFHANQ